MQRFAEGKKQRASEAFAERLANAGYQGDIQQAKDFMEYYLQLHDGIDDAESGRAMARETIVGTAKMLNLTAEKMMSYLPPEFGTINLPENMKSGVQLPGINASAVDGIYRIAKGVYNEVYPEQSRANGNAIEMRAR